MQKNVLEYFELTCGHSPQKVAVTDKRGSLTFQELRTYAMSIARSIVDIGNAINQPVAFFLPKSSDAVASLLGVLYSGNFYVPLDVKAPVERLRIMLDNLSPTCIVTNRELLPILLDAGFAREQVITLEDVKRIGPFKDKVEWAFSFENLIDTDPVYVIYTSGSTGVPKGVTIPHRGVIDYINWANTVYDVDENDIIGSQAPLFFDNSTLDLYLCFSKGATLHLIPDELFTFPLKLIEHLRDIGVTFIFWVPSLMTNISNFDIFASVCPISLDKVLFAGEVMPAKTLNYWRRYLPNTLFSNLYGPTEITVDCTYYIVDRHIADDEPVPIGYPCRNSDVLILNENDELAGPNETGELCVRGSSLALGYWNAPEKTDLVFVQNPVRKQYPERIYRTGDLVQKNQQGEIIFLGRKDSQIKHQGYRIELGEIETAAGLLAGVRSVCVLYNTKKQEITLFYESESEMPARELREQLAQRLPRYMLPSAFIWLTLMPINANGKIDRKAIANKYSINT
jgi:D-alanine--poly(phosphoribitol) ligase subunit 1